MAWIPGYEERYNDPPVTGKAVWAALGRPLAKANDSTSNSPVENAPGYVYDNVPARARPVGLHQVPVTEPLPAPILAAIREAAKARGESPQD